jgi:hypothetical protein
MKGHMTTTLDAPVETGSETTETAPIKLPANEHAYLQEILKYPVDGQPGLYEIPKNAGSTIYPGLKTAKSTANGAKSKLIKRGVLESIQDGDPGHRAVVKVLTTSVVLNENSKGRPRGSVSKTKTVKTVRKPRAAKVAKTEPAAKVRKTRTSRTGFNLATIRAQVTKNNTRVEKYLKLMETISSDYKDLFELSFTSK